MTGWLLGEVVVKFDKRPETGIIKTTSERA